MCSHDKTHTPLFPSPSPINLPDDHAQSPKGRHQDGLDKRVRDKIAHLPHHH